MDQDRRNTTQAKTEPRGFYGEEAEVQNMSPPPIYNPNYPPPTQTLRKARHGSNVRLHMPAAAHSTTACINQQ